MRDPEKPGAPYRPGSSPATLNDLRWVYKKLNEVEALLRSMQAEQFRLNGRVAEDRAHLGAIVQNTNQLISLILPTDAEIRQLRRMYRDQLLPSRNPRGMDRIRSRRRRGRQGQDATE